jgi:transposase
MGKGPTLANVPKIHTSLNVGRDLPVTGHLTAPGTISPLLHFLLVENRELRIIERQLLTFMLRFTFGYYSHSDIQRHLRNMLPSEDLDLLYAYSTSASRHKKIRATIILLHLYGIPKKLIAEGLCIYVRTVSKCIQKYNCSGLHAVYPPRKRIKKAEDLNYKQALFSVLHTPPKCYGFNRTTWRVQDLVTTMVRIGMPIGKNRITEIIKTAGYRFMKAREVLTSNDPDYWQKLDYIQQILSTLGETERFFSIDEFGPVAVKRQGGRRLVGPGEYPTIPQFQKSKGSLILTAALELSTNQVTHFYSNGKNTNEMIRLLRILVKKYRRCTRLYLSWDAAGWHGSKKFTDEVKKVNSRIYRKVHGTPIVELAPLPARSQFLNVIESVFNGLAVSVIHNSDYASVDEAKAAIDRYFEDRNWHFQKNPKRAGNKIWGKERVACTFSEGQNCKNPRFR